MIHNLSFAIFLTVLLCAQSQSINDNIVIDCFPDPNANQQKCEQRGCVWQPSSTPNAPWCHFDTSDPSKFAGYTVSSHSDDMWVMVRRNTPTLFGGDKDMLYMQVDAISDDHVAIKIAPKASRQGRSTQASNKYEIQVQGDPFGFAVVRKDSGVAIFDTRSIPGFTFAEQYIQLTTKTPTDRVYGIGEQQHTHLKRDFNWKKFALFARDRPPGGNLDNLYGSHPFYLGLEPSGSAYGVFLNTTYGMNIALQPQPSALTYRTMGGLSIDLHVFLGPTADTVIQQYTSGAIGLPALPPRWGMGLDGDTGAAFGVLLNSTYPANVALQPDPNAITYRFLGGEINLHFFLGPTPVDVVTQYVKTTGLPLLPPKWGMGFQLSRYGYPDLDAAITVYNRNIAAHIPLDVMYFDIDFMDNYRDFTIGEKFKTLPQFADTLHAANKSLVLMVDAAIGTTPTNYPAYKLGMDMNVFVKDGANPSLPFLGKVWPGLTYYPDFTHPNATAYWAKLHAEFHKVVAFDGVWNDMNEPSNFVPGSQRMNGTCTQSSINFPPFNPLTNGDQIFVKTLCMDAIHHAGRHYELHNVYGATEIRTSYAALSQVFPNKRPYILSRSTFPGSGQYAAKWTGDVTSNWPQLSWSIIGMLDFNMFGMPWVGADICGFIGNTNQELCVRWQQVGSFYPFSRNHNTIGAIPQDPAVWDKGAVAAIRSALLLRYSLLAQFYSIMGTAAQTGAPAVRPLFFSWPTDSETYDLSTQFMWDTDLMFAPVLQQGATSRSVYFPGTSDWFTYPSGAPVAGLSTDNRHVTVPMALNETGIFMNHKSIIATHVDILSEPLGTISGIADVFSRPLHLMVVPDAAGHAMGSLFWDDGQTPNTIRDGLYERVQMTMEPITGGLKLELNLEHPWTARSEERPFPAVRIDSVSVTGYQRFIRRIPRSILQRGSCEIVENGNTRPCSSTFLANTGVLRVQGMNIELGVDNSKVIMNLYYK